MTKNYERKFKISNKFWTLIDLSIVDNYLLPPYEDLVQVTLLNDGWQSIYYSMGSLKPETVADCRKLSFMSTKYRIHKVFDHDIWVMAELDKGYVTVILDYKA